jgi:putative FmdB family regulatory protein
MPIYEYRCSACKEIFEKIVPNASAKVSCPECGGRKVERLPSAFGIGGSSRRVTSSSSSCSGCSRGSCSGCH